MKIKHLNESSKMTFKNRDYEELYIDIGLDAGRIEIAWK